METKLKPCECSGWQNGMPQIIGAQCLADNHGIKYTGGTFLFCPWCGTKREEEIVN